MENNIMGKKKKRDPLDSAVDKFQQDPNKFLEASEQGLAQIPELVRQGKPYVVTRKELQRVADELGLTFEEAKATLELTLGVYGVSLELRD